MKVGLYPGGGHVVVAEREKPVCPPGGLLVRTEACGLCSGELMTWYMDGKAPHVLGHECCGIIEESDSAEFPVGHRVFVHHHAPCMTCSFCHQGAHVHCAQWKRTKLDPGGMAEWFAAGPENLTDAFLCDDLAPEDAALIEPLACVVKSVARGLGSAEVGFWPHPQVAKSGAHRATKAKVIRKPETETLPMTIIGSGALGLMHALLLREYGPVILDLKPERTAYAQQLGFKTEQENPADFVFVLPGVPNAIETAIECAAPNATIVLFAPLPPNTALPISAGERAYFQDLTLINSYSCGPLDTWSAYEALRQGGARAKDIVSDFIGIDELPAAYERMKNGEILKAMVMFK